jgi:hypothetical protein
MPPRELAQAQAQARAMVIVVVAPLRAPIGTISL